MIYSQWLSQHRANLAAHARQQERCALARLARLRRERLALAEREAAWKTQQGA